MRRTLSATTISVLLLSFCLTTPAFAQVVPAKGSSSTLDIASWNIEWFGDTANGPANESLQLQNARAVIAGADLDIWGVAEIVSVDAPAREGAALLLLCHTLFFAHRLDEMAARAGEALRVAESSGDERLRIETLAFIGRRHVSLGNLSEARQVIDESIRLARKLDHKPALIAGFTWRGLLHFFQSEYERAEEMLAEALRLSSEQRDGFIVLFCLYFLGLTRGNLGRMSEALAALDERRENTSP